MGSVDLERRIERLEQAVDAIERRLGIAPAPTPHEPTDPRGGHYEGDLLAFPTQDAPPER